MKQEWLDAKSKRTKKLIDERKHGNNSKTTFRIKVVRKNIYFELQRVKGGMHYQNMKTGCKNNYRMFFKTIKKTTGELKILKLPAVDNKHWLSYVVKELY